MADQMSKVYFVRSSKQPLSESAVKLERLLDYSGILSRIGQDQRVLLKMHFGEHLPGGFVHPDLLASVASKIDAQGASAFTADTNTLYRGTRNNTIDHLNSAHEHGFCISSIGVPVVIAGGVFTETSVLLPTGGKYVEQASIVEDIMRADSIVVVSHFKGHQLFGFGGGLKNLAMGSASRQGKLQMHSTVKPFVSERCTACGSCVEWCPADAIAIEGDTARIDESACIGCAECITVCPEKAVKIRWNESTTSIQYKLIDYFSGIVRNFEGYICYINVLFDLTPLCDCVGQAQDSFTRDVGIACSLDPVALDQASADLVNESVSEERGQKVDIFRELHSETDWTIQLEYAKELELGNRNYELTELPSRP
jgi:hypothetical protein